MGIIVGLAILFAIGSGFYKSAKKKGLNAGLYAFLSIVFWFGPQLIAGLILGVVYPEIMDDIGLLLIVGLGSSVIGIIILAIIMNNAAKKKTEVVRTNDEIMDDASIDDL